MKTLSKLQEEQMELIRGLEHPRIGDTLALLEEAGELTKEVIEIEMYGESRKEELASEAADVLFSLISLCNSYGINLSQAYERKAESIQRKIPEWNEKYRDKLKALRDKHN